MSKSTRERALSPFLSMMGAISLCALYFLAQQPSDYLTIVLSALLGALIPCLFWFAGAVYAYGDGYEDGQQVMGITQAANAMVHAAKEAS